MTEKPIPTTIYMDKDQTAQLIQVAETYGVSKSTVMRICFATSIDQVIQAFKKREESFENALAGETKNE